MILGVKGGKKTDMVFHSHGTHSSERGTDVTPAVTPVDTDVLMPGRRRFGGMGTLLSFVADL